MLLAVSSLSRVVICCEVVCVAVKLLCGRREFGLSVCQVCSVCR